MKIIVLNSSGNMGKSVISRELLYPRLEGCEIVEVETVNSGGKDFPDLRVTQFKAGDDFAELYLKIMTIDNLIVDVGASNLSAFWTQLSNYAGIETMFDYFIVPTVPNPKEMTDTFKTLAFLEESGIDMNKVKTVFNRVKNDVKTDFSTLINAGRFNYDLGVYVPESALFNDLGFLRKTIDDVYNPDLNYYKDSILSAETGAEKLLLIKMDLANRMAVSMKAHLDNVFSIVTGTETAVKAIKVEEPKADKVKGKKVEEVAEEALVSDADEEL